ncbi:MAG: alpha/beta hydrolase [Ruminococcaceae bacterium]|nr:alpha/beta hydrolase [Oscillospiraceae bacterium]
MLKFTVTLPSDAAHSVIYLLNDSMEVSALPHAAVVSVEVPDWNRDLSPWKAERVFRKRDDFAGGAKEFLHKLLEIVPEAEKMLGFVPEFRGIAGYSLAGLFAVWTLYRTDVFSRAASMSGSLWFDGFAEFMEEHRPVNAPEKVYLSVGEREKQTKNVRMAQVEACTVRTAEILRGYGTDVRFDLNPGGHFDEVPGRIGRGLRWIGEPSELK